MSVYDSEGDSIVRACACAKILHGGHGDVVRRLQVALARICVEYSVRMHMFDSKAREAFLARMTKDIEAKQIGIMKEVSDGEDADGDWGAHTV